MKRVISDQNISISCVSYTQLNMISQCTKMNPAHTNKSNDFHNFLPKIFSSFSFHRLLAQFAFNLSVDWEIPKRKIPKKDSLKESVRDMLVKHHLFSWDL